MIKDPVVIHVRVSREDLYEFKEKCAVLNQPYSEIVREMMVAFIDGRLNIAPTEHQKQRMEEIYNVD